MNAPSRSSYYSRRQRGIVLPVALIMLLVLTISSLVIVEQISSQTRMATNAQVAQISLQAAESGLRTVVNELSGGTISSAPATYLADAGGYYYFVPTNYSSSTSLPWENTSTWNSLTNAPAITCTSPGSYMAVTSCKYMIEMLPAVSPPGSNAAGGKTLDYVYRITVRVVGPNNQGTVMLQTLFLVPNT
jgi:type IV pilus assembly protein PilX